MLLLGSHIEKWTIWTAKPSNCVQQEDYADYTFHVIKSGQYASLKAKLHRERILCVRALVVSTHVCD
ncbi:hypothetical protein SEVIR_6G235501v4 [Setaria viridis]